MTDRAEPGSTLINREIMEKNKDSYCKDVDYIIIPTVQ
jgi:hypothetical protein